MTRYCDLERSSYEGQDLAGVVALYGDPQVAHDVCLRWVVKCDMWGLVRGAIVPLKSSLY